jgi:hypothetical protein
MRYLLPKLFVLAATALSLTARADTLLDFTLSGPSGTVTFTLPEHPFFQETLHLVTVGTRTSASLNGVSGYTADLTFFTGIADPGESLILDVFSFDPTFTDGFSVNLNGPLILYPYYGSDYPAPPGDFTGLLQTGATRLYTYSSTGMPIYYFLDATPEAATTPEPSTLILLLTGAGGLLATRRRAPRVDEWPKSKSWVPRFRAVSSC